MSGKPHQPLALASGEQGAFNIAEFVSVDGSKTFTDSRRVARHFGRDHKNVLRAYDRLERELERDPEFYRLHFEPVIDAYQNGKGGTQMGRVIRMSKDGFVLLVMGFTGGEAARIRIAYIRAFNLMADALKQVNMGLWSQRLSIETQDAHSFARASDGSRAMNDRKRDLPKLMEDRKKLDDVMQCPLFDVIDG